MKKQVKVIIGANYGDEGKGLATRYFAEKANENKCLNVLFNGGCQRGHTLELKGGFRHVFHHFGSASSLDYVDNYFDQNFMLNPIFFVKEYKELYYCEYNMRCYGSENCRIITPYDAFINQIVESKRSNSRHGSCGHGILETRKRFEDGKYTFCLGDLNALSDEEIVSILRDIASKYLPERLLAYGIEGIPDEFTYLLDSDGLISNYIADLREMQKHITIIDFDSLINNYGCILFEGGQGLELDEYNMDGYPFLTPSSTTSYIPVQRIADLDCDIEICYVSRAYFTRHGAGPFSSECSKSDINPQIKDFTNVPNKYQEMIRYGKFVKEEFLKRVKADMKDSSTIRTDLKFSLLITHLNYTENKIAGNCSLNDLVSVFDNVYLSRTPYAEDICISEVDI